MKYDMAVLNMLRSNSRSGWTEMARALDMHISTVFETEKRLRTQGCITRYVSIVNYGSIGYNIRILIIVKYGRGLLLQIMKHRAVNNVNLCSDKLLIVEAVFHSIEDLVSFSAMLPKHDEIYLLEELKYEGAYLS